MRKALLVGHAEVLRETEGALLVDVQNEELWIPKAAVSEISEVQEDGDEGDLWAAPWWVEENGLVAEREAVKPFEVTIKDTGRGWKIVVEIEGVPVLVMVEWKHDHILKMAAGEIDAALSEMVGAGAKEQETRVVAIWNRLMRTADSPLFARLNLLKKAPPRGKEAACGQ